MICKVDIIYCILIKISTVISKVYKMSEVDLNKVNVGEEYFKVSYNNSPFISSLRIVKVAVKSISSKNVTFESEDGCKYVFYKNMLKKDERSLFINEIVTEKEALDIYNKSNEQRVAVIRSLDLFDIADKIRSFANIKYPLFKDMRMLSCILKDTAKKLDDEALKRQ